MVGTIPGIVNGKNGPMENVGKVCQKFGMIIAHGIEIESKSKSKTKTQEDAR